MRRRLEAQSSAGDIALVVMKKSIGHASTDLSKVTNVRSGSEADALSAAA